MAEKSTANNFIKSIIVQDIADEKSTKVHTRFPPEPNGFLHIGHAKSMCLNFGLADEFQGLCNMRFDDTNPVKEDKKYVDAILDDVRWLGYDWGERLFFASDYFDQLYDFAMDLIRQGKAYVCSLSNEQIRDFRGTLKQPGKNSPYRDRTIEENLDLFARMRQGEFADGEHVLRAKIDMASPNINLRDPVIYRILKTHHHRTGDDWFIYPMYDYTHCISDALEGITYSLCTLEFEDHRPLYDWFLDQLDVPTHPRQIEFARLNLSFTVLSKRKLLQLVNEKYVNGWDDPRMPTLAGLRRRGCTPASIKKFCDMIGVAKADNIVDIAMLEYAIREDLNQKALRAMAVLHPIKVIIDNFPEDHVEWLDADNNPENPDQGKRQIPFTKEIFIETEDFKEVPPKKYRRLSPGKEVRLVHAYYVTCTSLDKDENGNIVAIHCDYDPQTKGGWSEDGRKVKGTIHWVSVPHAQNAQVRLYNSLFTLENPENLPADQSFLDCINPDSLEIIDNCKVEPMLAESNPGQPYQFLRTGYFVQDKDFSPQNPVYNRTVGLRDSWAKIAAKDTSNNPG